MSTPPQVPLVDDLALEPDIATAGAVRSITIVAFGPAGVAVPYVAAVIDCGGTTDGTRQHRRHPSPILSTCGSACKSS